ncbi:MAG TPA: cytochrome c [Flavipsychrobacter sp.]|nr:cytochrome c [Flavipsychrobacter sp.]
MRVNDYTRKIILTSLCGWMAAAGCRTHYNTTKAAFPVNTQASVARGKMLVMSSCAGCHFDPATKSLTGKQYMETPKIAGKVYSANLTQSKKSPLAHYSDAEFAYLIRTGIAHDGRFLPYMLRPNMSDEDISAMLSFLRSDDGAVVANDHVQGITHLNIIGKMGKPFLGKPLPYQATVRQPDMDNEVVYGRYMVDNIGCYHCHSAGKKLNDLEPEKTKGYMAGGRKFKMPGGSVRGSNITPDRATGIGDYSQADFRRAVLECIDRDGRKLSPPMEGFPMTNKEADAIYAYIKTLTPKKHKVN